MKMVQAGFLFLVFYFGVIVSADYITNKVTFKTKSTSRSTIKFTPRSTTKAVSKSTTKPTNIFTTTKKPITDNGLKKCGVPAIKPISSNSRIIGGVPAKPHSWPWQISLQHNSNPDCGGSIINNTIILTTAHCFDDKKNIKEWKVVAGEDIISVTTDGPTQTRDIKKLIIHEHYLPLPLKMTNESMNDIAILVLSSPLVFNDNISPICLPNVKVTQSENCYATGWGVSEISDPDSEDKLRQARLPIINPSIISTLSFGNRIANTELCAGYINGGINPCFGDSGGPLVCQKSDNKWYLDGMPSWSYGCFSYPGIYTRVFSYINWIVEKTGIQL